MNNMKAFDGVFIGAIIALFVLVAQVILGVIKEGKPKEDRNPKEDKNQKGTSMTIVVLIFFVVFAIAALWWSAVYYQWESDILGIQNETAPVISEPTTVPTEMPTSEPITVPTETLFSETTEPTAVITELPVHVTSEPTTVPTEQYIPTIPKKTYTRGETIPFGTYEQDNNLSTKEPLIWTVLDVEDGRALLLCANAIDCIPYNEQKTSCTWATCTLRKWLKESFYNVAFSNEEQKQIALTKVKASSNPYYSTYPGEDTDDYVFLLSVDEVNQYFSNNIDRRCVPSNYAISSKDGFRNNDLGTCWWWLRTPGITSLDACSINSDGTIDTDDGTVDSVKGCVRPAMWIYTE